MFKTQYLIIGQEHEVALCFKHVENLVVVGLLLLLFGHF